MKRCPECRRDFYDDRLSFCLDDGTPLLDGPATDEPPTAIQRNPESATAILPATSAIDVGPSTTSDQRPGNRTFLITGAFALLVLLATAAGFAIYKFRPPESVASQPFQSIKIERLT